MRFLYLGEHNAGHYFFFLLVYALSVVARFFAIPQRPLLDRDDRTLYTAIAEAIIVKAPTIPIAVSTATCLLESVLESLFGFVFVVVVVVFVAVLPFPLSPPLHVFVEATQHVRSW